MTKTYEVVDELEEAVMSRTDLIRRANRRHEGNLWDMFPDFFKWFSSLARFGGNLIDATIIEVLEPFEKPIRVRVTFFTERHQYAIRFNNACVTKDSGHASYLGATVSKRAPRAGEDRTRGSDLADGIYCEETWKRILSDIVAYEMVRLGK